MGPEQLGHSRTSTEHAVQKLSPRIIPWAGWSTLPGRRSHFREEINGLRRFCETAGMREGIGQRGRWYDVRPPLRPRAGARHERTLFAVACKPLFGAGSGTDMAWPSQPPDSGASPRLRCDGSLSYTSLEPRLSFPGVHTLTRVVRTPWGAQAGCGIRRHTITPAPPRDWQSGHRSRRDRRW